MATCTLRIGDRVVVASSGGAPEVEYLLFDPAEVEFGATGVGSAQEIGYQTTAKEAITRLRTAGFTLPLLLECASAMQPTLAITYARGPAIRRIATALGPTEIFEGSKYDATTKSYDGRWLDLASMSTDAGIEGLSQSLQALYLLALLREVSPTDSVRLITRDLMARGRSGSRSYRRYNFTPPSGLSKTIREVAHQIRDAAAMLEDRDGPASEEVLERVGDRIAFAADIEARARLRALEKTIEIRNRPAEPPLGDPELWAVDEQLSSGNAEGVTELVDSIEQSKGKHPATDYLRVRAAFLAGRETPRAVAERVASLALATPTFVQLQLLATEAWSAAGDPDRALLFARDLLGETSVDRGMPSPPSQQLAGERAPSSRGAPSIRPPASMRAPSSVVPSPVSRRPVTLPPSIAQSPPPSPLSRRPVTMPPSVAPSALASRRPVTAPPIDPSSPPSDRPNRTSDAPTLYVAASKSVLIPPASSPISSSKPPASNPAPTSDARRIAYDANTQLRGASQPPFRSDTAQVHIHVPRAAAVPRMADRVEEAAALALPDGLRGAPAGIEALPRSVLDARVQFTFQSRELGIQYQDRLGIRLYADVSGLEAMQRVLLERYGGRSLNTAAETADARRHGAFLSEILARSLSAFWVDVGPSDLGYWAMLVPPDTRVWPFGWIHRVIAKGGEDKLTDYFAELSSRAGSVE